jgi:hypothetical protein
MSTADPPKPPIGLRAPGKRLWDRVLSRYVLTESEMSMLAEACRTTDELDRLQRAIRALPQLTTAGSTGQTIIHPLLAAADRHRRLLEKLTTALNLPDDGQAVGLRGPSRYARRAVTERWKKARKQDGDPSGTAGSNSAG